MLATFVVSLREGIEAFLIVAIMLAYLRKTGQRALQPAVYAGVGVALILSAGLGIWLMEAGIQAVVEGWLALITAVLVASLAVHMQRVARTLKKNIEARLESQAAKASAWAFAGIFAFTVLMITREGMEAALVIVVQASSSETGGIIMGSLLGLIGAAALAWAWSRWGHRVDLGLFFRVTTIFLMIFVVQLLIYAFHEFTEAGALPFVDNAYWHLTTEPYGPEGVYGQALTWFMVLVPLAWLVWSLAKRPRTATGTGPA